MRPSLIERLLLWTVGRDARGRSVAGDLREEYALRPAGLNRSFAYALACLRVVIRYAPGRVALAVVTAVDTLRLDLRQSARSLRHSPVYWLGCLLTLAIGIGATATIGTIVHGALLRPLPFPHPERLVRLGDASIRNPVGISSVSVLNFMDLRQSAKSFDVMAAYSSERAIVTGPDLSERLQGAFVTPNFFDVFELPPLAGRWFEDTDREATPRVVIVSERVWRRMMNARPDAIGRTIQIDLVDHVVIGIASASQIGLGAVDFWKPSRWSVDPATARRRRSIEPVGRLRAGVSVDQARDELRTLMAELGRRFPQENAAWTMNVVPMSDWIGSFGSSNGRAMLQLVGAGALVLMAVALINVTSLTLGRSEQRRHEAVIRRALGASKRRVFAQQLTEGLLIGLPAGLAGAWLAAWAVPLIVAKYGDTFPRSQTVAFDASSVCIAAGTGVIAAVCIALLASVKRATPDASLRTDGRGSSPASLQMRRVLVTSQIALSALLLQAALLVAGTIHALSRVDMGVPLDQATTFEIGLPSNRYPDAGRIARAVDDLTTRLRALPGVIDAGATTRRPFAGGTNGEVSVADDPARALPLAEYRAVTPGFFAAIGLAVREGRTFTDAIGTGPAESTQVVISEQLAQELFAGSSALGRRLRTVATAPPVEVIGVVSNFRDFGPVRSGRPTIYFRHSFNDVFALSPFSTVIVRHDKAATNLVPQMREALREVDGDVPMDAVLSMQALADRSAGTSRRTAAAMLLWFTGVALALGAIGIFGVIAFNVERRRREIGIRLAVGDTPAGIGRRVLGEGVKLTIAGLAVAAIGSLWIRTALASFVLADMTPRSWLVFTAVAGVIGVLTIAACLVPARRAAHTSLVTVLRD